MAMTRPSTGSASGTRYRYLAGSRPRMARGGLVMVADSAKKCLRKSMASGRSRPGRRAG
jgi:hypothetical protein